MCSTLTTRVNALTKVCWSADFKTRKMVANAIVMSRLVYLVQLYGDGKDYLLASLQVLENKAARAVTRLPWGTPTAVVLNQIGWLSIKQLTVYHQLISVYKIKCDQKPVYLWEKFRDKFNYKTRQATGNCLQVSRTPKSDTSKDSFVHKSTILWNTLPVKLRTSQLSLLKFKMELKIWVKANIQI